MRFALTTSMRSAPSFAPADAADDRGPRGVNKSLLDVAGVGPKGVMRFALTTTMRSAPSFAPADAADDRFKFYTYLPTLLLSY